MATPHIEAKQNEIAKTVLMPGDPLRAKYIAENYLEDVVKFNNVRNMFGYTGTFNGKRVSVMGSGMGMPSMGIYSYELFKFYDVENIIRIGSTGAYTKDLDLYDVIVVDSVWTESTYAKAQSGKEINENYPSKELYDVILTKVEQHNIEIVTGKIHSNDVFYSEDFNRFNELRDTHGVIAVEMESFALFHNAQVLGKNAACILTVSDNLVTKEETSSEERQNAFTKMMELALATLEE